MHAFDRDSGRQLWVHRAGRGVIGAVIGSAGPVVAYAITGDLIALNRESGKPEWTYRLNGNAWESPGAVGSRVFGASNDGSVYAFNSETGRIEWQQKLGAGISTSVRATESVVYVGTADGLLHRIATGSGEVLSVLQLDPLLEPGAAPVVTQDAVLVLLVDEGADYRALVSVDPALARIRWRRPAPNRWSTSRIFLTENTIVLGTPSGELIAYCAADGALAWSHTLSAAPIRSIGGSDEMLYVGTPEGTLYALRPPPSCT